MAPLGRCIMGFTAAMLAAPYLRSQTSNFNKIYWHLLCVCIRSVTLLTFLEKLDALAEGREQNFGSCQSDKKGHAPHERTADPVRKWTRSLEPPAGNDGRWLMARKGKWRAETPGGLTSGVGRRTKGAAAEPRARRRAAAPEGAERRSGSPAERGRGLWAGSEEAHLPRCRGRWSWCVRVGGGCGWAARSWRVSAGGRGCEAAAPACPRNRKRRKRRRTKGRAEADRSVDEDP